MIDSTPRIVFGRQEQAVLDRVDAGINGRSDALWCHRVDGDPSVCSMRNVDGLPERRHAVVGLRAEALARPVADDLHPRRRSGGCRPDGFREAVLISFVSVARVVATG
jgi:hypothetical protein